jgi:GTP-binding protein
MILGNVALVGRPNVGKSTLFNRLVGSKKSIVSDKKGVTRDFLMEKINLRKDHDESCLLFDTGGYETDDVNFQPFSKNLVWQQTEHAIEKADLVVFMLDAKEGLQPFDRDILNYLLKLNKPILPVINKVDGIEKESLTWEFFELRINNFLTISAAHSRGIQTLRDKIAEELDLLKATKSSYKFCETAKKLALIGRPNAGKSSILNRLLGEERSLVSDIAGTTRDRVDGYFTYNKEDYLIIDTAGIRRRTKIKEDLEKASVIKSIESIEDADMILFIFDATEEITDQDIRLINLAVNRYKPVLLVVNKWDLIADKNSKTLDHYKKRLQEFVLKDRSYLPIHFVSCKLNLRIHNIMPFVEKLLAQTSKRVKTSEVNTLIQTLVHKHSPRIIKGLSKRVKFYYATQIETNPPTFVIKCNVAKELQESYKKYIMHSIKDELGFAQIPIKVLYEAKKEGAKERKEEAPMPIED